MKNPYRKLEHRPLRTMQAATLLLLMIIKLVPIFILVLDIPVDSAFVHRLTLIGLVLATSCLLDLGTLYSVTLGFNDLLDRPWFILLSAGLNALLAIAAGAFFGINTFATTGPGLPWWTGPLRVSLISLVLLMQIGSALILFVRLRSNRPLPY
jgi:hypothetical protein